MKREEKRREGTLGLLERKQARNWKCGRMRREEKRGNIGSAGEETGNLKECGSIGSFHSAGL